MMVKPYSDRDKVVPGAAMALMADVGVFIIVEDGDAAKFPGSALRASQALGPSELNNGISRHKNSSFQ